MHVDDDDGMACSSFPTVRAANLVSRTLDHNDDEGSPRSRCIAVAHTEQLCTFMRCESESLKAAFAT